MGCDIHIYTEVKVNNTWVHIDHVEVDENGYIQSSQITNGRDYNLFALLANVRNYGTVNPISEPKGLPIDASESVKSISRQWDGDGHSHSFLTYSELLNSYEENKEIRITGLLNPEQIEELKKGILPTHWCQGNNQGDYYRHYWTEKNHSFINIMNELEKIFLSRDIKSADDLRIVFFFDN